MEAWQKPGEVNTGTALGLSQHLPAGCGSPGHQAHGYSQAQSLTLAPGCCRHSWTEMQLLLSRCHGISHVPRLRLASKSQKVAMLSSTASLQQCPCSPRHWSHSGATAAPWVDSSLQPLLVGFGELVHTASGHSILSQQEAHLGATCLLGSPSSGVLALMLPEKFLSPWVKSIHLPYFKPKGTYPSSPSLSGKLLFQVSSPSPRTLFEKQNISDGKRCHWSHTRTKPQSHKEQDIFPHHKLPVGALLQKTQQTKAQSPLSLQACPLQNPTQAQKAAGSQPSGRPGGRSGSASPGTRNCCTKASKGNTPRGKINKELDQQQTLLRAINSTGISRGFLV